MVEESTPINDVYGSVAAELARWIISFETFKEINARSGLLVGHKLAQESNADATEKRAIKMGELYTALKEELKTAGLPAIKLNAKNLKWEANETLSLGRNSLNRSHPYNKAPVLFALLSYGIPFEILDVISNKIEQYGYNFSGSNFRKADIRGADFSRATLIGVDLSGADFSGVDILGATFFSPEELNESEEKLSKRFIGIRGLDEKQILNLSDAQQTKLMKVLTYNGIDIIPSSGVIQNDEPTSKER